MLIESKNWSEYQSFRKDRASTSWIKLHTKLLNNFQFNKLSPSNKWCVIGIWMIIDRKTGKIEIEEDELIYKVGVKSLDLNALHHFFVITDNTTDNQRSTSGKPVVTSGQPVVNPEKRREEKSRVEKNRVESFLTFWDKYPKTCPRKNNKKGTKVKFIDIISKDESAFTDIMDGLDKAISCRQWLDESGKFIPAPIVWLNQERWLDDYDDGADNSVSEKMEGLGL